MGALEPFSAYMAVQQDDAITLTWDPAPPRYELVEPTPATHAILTGLKAGETVYLMIRHSKMVGLWKSDFIARGAEKNT